MCVGPYLSLEYLKLLCQSFEYMDTPTLMDIASVCKTFRSKAIPILKERTRDGIERKINLTDEQLQVYDAVMSGKSIFFTGKAGSGKSMLLRTLVNDLQHKKILVTAPTGVAAFNIGGVTLHSLASINKNREHPIVITERIEASEKLTKLWKTLEVLIIDEISMLEGYLFQALERVARTIRRNKLPFGGIQLVLCGDFLQLPPVNDAFKRGIYGVVSWYCFQMEAWHACIDKCFELQRVLRQRNQQFINMLNEVRLGRLSRQTVNYLEELSKEKIEYIEGPHLYAKNNKVNQINRARLSRLEGKSYTFLAKDVGCDSKTIDEWCPVEDRLQLKVGAKVMLRKNLAVLQGLTNGVTGVVVEIIWKERQVVVEFVQGSRVTLSPMWWQIRDATGNVIGQRRQLPLTLAWAFSIHKVQGQTFKEDMFVDLEDVFSSGQAYVALSRTTRPEYLHVRGFKVGKIRAKHEVLKFYDHMQAWSSKDLPLPTLQKIYPYGWTLGGSMVSKGERPSSGESLNMK